MDALVAIRAGGKGDISQSHVLWRAYEGIGQVPSPLFYQGRIYLIKHGGNVTCYNAKTGEKVYGNRIGQRVYYFASPIAADNKIYFCSSNGNIIVLQAGEKFKILAENKIGGRIQKRDRNGNWSLVASGQGGPDALKDVCAIAFDASNSLYVGEKGRIRKRDDHGRWSVLAIEGKELGQVTYHYAIVPDRDGDLYVADVGSEPMILVQVAGLFQSTLYQKTADPMLLALVSSGDREVSYHAAYSLAECKDVRLAPLAAAFAADRESRFRWLACHWSVSLPHESFLSIRPSLLPMLKDEEEDVFDQALRCFTRHRDPEAGNVILEMLKKDKISSQLEVTVMQCLSEMAGTQFGYTMHTWGPGKGKNTEAIEKFENWLKELD